MLSFSLWNPLEPEAQSSVVFVKNEHYPEYIEFVDSELIGKPTYAFRIANDLTEALGLILLSFEKKYDTQLEGSQILVTNIKPNVTYEDQKLNEAIGFIFKLDEFCRETQESILSDSLIGRTELSDFSSKWWGVDKKHTKKSKLLPPKHKNLSRNPKTLKVQQNVELIDQCIEQLSDDNPKSVSVILSAYYFAAAEFAQIQNRPMSALIYFHRSLENALFARCIEEKLLAKGSGGTWGRLFYTYPNYTNRRASVSSSFELLQYSSKLVPTAAEKALVSKINVCRNSTSMTHSIFCPKLNEVSSLKNDLYKFTKVLLASSPKWSRYLSAFLFKYEVSLEHVLDIYPDFSENMVQIYP